MKKLIDHCKVCRGDKIEHCTNYTHDDVFSGETVVISDVWFCVECDTVHYEDPDNKKLTFEFHASTLTRAKNLQNWRTRND